MNIEEKVRDLLARMTREEKAGLLTGLDMWHLRTVERLGLPTIRVTDCGHGVTLTGERSSNGTCFPTAVGQAATWNRDLIEEVGAVLGRETRALGCSLLLGPMVNIHRVPVGGRNYETYSEDPFLAGKMASALVRGIQSTGTGACLKGFTANNQQQDQEGLSVEVDERALREIYCPAFRIPIEENPPCAVMTAYNGINGYPTAANKHTIRDILKGEWGYKGVVLSDWRGVHGTESIDAGLDLEMPGPGKYMRKEDVLDALERGVIDEAELDDRAGRLLGLILKCTPEEKLKTEGPETPEHGHIALRTAEESVTLLKNENHILPFDKNKVKKVAVIGPNAEQARLGGGGSASMCPPYQVSVLDALEKLYGKDIEIIYEEGCGLTGSLPVLTGKSITSPEGTAGLKVEYFRNTDLAGEPFRVGRHRQVDFSWGWASPTPGMPRNDYSIRWSARLTPSRTGSHPLGVVCSGGGFRLFVNDKPVVDRWEAVDPQTRGKKTVSGSSVVELAVGKPAALRLEYKKVVNPAAIRLQWQEPDAADPVEKAARAAADADAAVVCAGISNNFEGGTLDRDNLDLPGDQERLIKAVAQANPRTVVVLNSGTPLNIAPWVHRVPALLNAWYPGQEGGTAIARILFGAVNPSGKLPDTLPQKLDDCLAMKYYPGDGKKVFYTEGVLVGYRQYDAQGIKPLFPFGFGLSYTEFKYDKLSISAPVLKGDDRLEVTVEVTNTGKRGGQETVQLYISDPEASVRRPPKELKGFKKISLEPGEMKTVTFTVTRRDLAFFDPADSCWKAEPGQFEIMVGPHSREGLTGKFEYRAGCRAKAKITARSQGLNCKK